MDFSEKFLLLANKMKDIGENENDIITQYREFRDEWWEVLSVFNYGSIMQDIKQGNMTPFQRDVLCYLVSTLAFESIIKVKERKGVYN